MKKSILGFRKGQRKIESISNETESANRNGRVNIQFSPGYKFKNRNARLFSESNNRHGKVSLKGQAISER
jgi:hypothetical protein